MTATNDIDKPKLNDSAQSDSMRHRQKMVNKIRYFLEYYNIGGSSRNPYMDRINGIGTGALPATFELADFTKVPNDIKEFLMVDSFASACVEHAILEIIGDRMPKMREKLEQNGGIKVSVVNAKNAFAAIPAELYALDLPEDLAMRIGNRKVDPDIMMDAIIAGITRRNQTNPPEVGKVVSIDLVVSEGEYAEVLKYCTSELDKYYRKHGRKGMAEELIHFDSHPRAALRRRIEAKAKEAWSEILLAARKEALKGKFQKQAEIESEERKKPAPLLEVPAAPMDDEEIIDESKQKEDE